MKTLFVSASLRAMYRLGQYLALGLFFLAGFSALAQPGLVAHYSFNGVFFDQTTNANHAIATGSPAFVADRNGQVNSAISLGGCGNPQFLRVPKSSSLQVTDAMTVAFWAKVDLSNGMDPGTGECTANGRQVFFAKAGDGYGVSPPGFLGLTYPEGGQQKIAFEANAGQANAITTRQQPGDAWHHYAYVLTNSEVKLYIDAQLVLSSPVDLSFAAANQQDLYLGVMGPKSSPVLGTTYWYPMSGALDDVRIFNRGLIPAEVSTVYASDDAGSCAPAAASILPAGDALFCEGQSITLKASAIPAEVKVQWLRDGQVISQANSDSLVVSQSGAYRIETIKRQDAWKSDIGGFKTKMNDIQFVGGNYGWIVGDYGLLLITTNGNSWDTIATGRQESFTAVNFVNTQVGFIGGANGLLLKTINGGASLFPLSIPVSGTVSKIKFANENIGYVLADRLLFKTMDGGDTWTGVTLPNSFGLEDMAFVDADFGWVASINNIYRTDNGGGSWVLQRTVQTCDPDFYKKIQKIHAIDRSNCWVVSNACSFIPTVITRTQDGGNTWVDYSLAVPSSFPSLSSLTVSEITFTDSQNGYIVGSIYKRIYAQYGISGGAVFRTQDGGQNWSLVYDNPFDSYPSAISFKSPTQGIVVGGKGLLLNVNSKGEVYTLNPTNRSFLTLKSVGGNGTNVFAVGGRLRTTSNGLHPDSKAVTMSSFGGQPWTKEESGLTPSQIKFKTSQFGWRSGYGDLSTTHNGGLTWQSIIPYGPGPQTVFEKAHFQSDSVGFALQKYYEGSPAELSSFSGTTRTQINIPYKDPSDPYNTGLLDLQFIDDNTGFITSSNGKLIKTTDGGNSWSVLPVRANTALSRVFFVTAQTGWVIGKGGLILKTNDGGVTWNQQTAGSTADLNGIWFLSAQEGYVVGTNGAMLKTANGGMTWVKIETNTHNTLNDITFTTRDKGYAVGESGTILSFNPTLLPDCKTTSAAVNVSSTPGTVCESTANGEWNSAATWSCGHVPLVCDQVAVSHVVTLNQSVQVRAVEIRQNGQLSVQGGNMRLEN